MASHMTGWAMSPILFVSQGFKATRDSAPKKTWGKKNNFWKECDREGMERGENRAQTTPHHQKKEKKISWSPAAILRIKKKGPLGTCGNGGTKKETWGTGATQSPSGGKKGALFTRAEGCTGPRLKANAQKKSQSLRPRNEIKQGEGGREAIMDVGRMPCRRKKRFSYERTKKGSGQGDHEGTS